MKPIKDIFKEMYPQIFRYIPTEPKKKKQMATTKNGQNTGQNVGFEYGKSRES